MFITAATSFEVAPGETNLVLLQAGGSSVVNLEYESTDTADYVFAASLDTGTTFDTSGATKNPTSKTITYTISPSFVTDGYGTYLLNFTLDDGTSGIDVYKEVVLFYEQAITGFQVRKILFYICLIFNEALDVWGFFGGGLGAEIEI